MNKKKSLKVQVLVAAMNQNDHALLDAMNIQTDAIVGNQCEVNSIEAFQWKGNSIKYLNFAERGVGLNRNNSLMRADGDICLIADDDLVYVNDYDKVVAAAFHKFPDADVIIFNLIENKESGRFEIKKFQHVGYLNYMRYGAARIAVRLSSIRNSGIFFNLDFGGGTIHGHGEDILFLRDCLKHGLKIYAAPYPIAELVENRDSTWFEGYNKKFFRDHAALFQTISRRFWKCLCLANAIKHHKIYGVGILEAYRSMVK